MSSQSIILGINEGGRLSQGGEAECPDCVYGNTTSLSSPPQTQDLESRIGNLETVKEKDFIIRRQGKKGQGLYLLSNVSFGGEKKIHIG